MTFKPSLANEQTAKPDCIIWDGYVDPGCGYGRKGRVYAHRAAYEAAHGRIPAGLNVLHTCDCKTCTNPNHLYVGTQLDNMRDYRERTESWERRGKLRAAHVIEIVHLRFVDGWDYLALSNRFHASPQAIANVCRGRTYANLTGINSDQPAPKVKSRQAKRLVDRAKRTAKKAKKTNGKQS